MKTKQAAPAKIAAKIAEQERITVPCATVAVVLLMSGGALAHGTSNVEARFAIAPPDAAAGSTASLEITLVPLEDGATANAIVEAKVFRDGVEQRLTLTRSEGEKFAVPLTLERGNADLRILLVRGDKREVAMSGFTVTDKLEPIPELNRSLYFNPAGRFDAIPWLDNLSGAVGALFAVVAIALLWRTRRRPEPRAQAPAPHEKPVAVLWLAAAGALAMPLGGYWDIAFHMDQGREGLFSPPHRLIYAGILISLMVIGASLLLGRPAGKSWRAHVTSDGFAFAAAVAAFLQLSSAPFDEVWHTLFGLDVSVWSPPHALLIFGAIAVCLCLAGLSVRGQGVGVDAARVLALAAAMLAADVFLAESVYPFPSWHVSQQRPAFVFVALEVVAAALVASVAVRVSRWRFAATASLAVFLSLRGALYPFLALLSVKAAPAFPLWLVALPLVGVVIDLAAARRALAG